MSTARTATTARERLLDALAAAGSTITHGGTAATCPAHEDHAPSLSIGQRRDRDGVLVNCHAGCTVDDVLAALGLTPADLFDTPREPQNNGRPVVVARYPYTDEAGEVLFEKVRMEPKTFRQCRQVDGRTVWSLGDARRVLYRLPDVLAAVRSGEPVYVAEGEKDADALARAGVTATTWTEGAWKPDQRPKWRREYTDALAGAHVVIVADRDEPGRHTAATIAAQVQAVAASVAVVEPTEGKDAADHLAAGRTVAELVPGEPGQAVEPDPAADEPDDESTPGETWRARDLGPTLAGLLAGTITRLEPTVLTRADDRALFYAGKVNGIAGASGSGKSWSALLACVQSMAAGGHVVYVDLEDDEAGCLERLLMLGADPAHLAGDGARFHYLRPDEAYGVMAAAELGELLARVCPALVVIDSTGESLALDGAKPNDDDDVARWFRRLPTRIARTGPAVVVLDHVVKADEGGLWPIGSQRKRAAVSGAQYMQSTVKAFDRETPGWAKLVCAKDRHGNYRQGAVVAELHVSPGEGVELRAPAERKTGGRWRPTALMERIAQALEDDTGPLSFRAIDDCVSGKADHKRTALRVLVDEGYVSVEDGPRNARLHTLVKPYAQRTDPESDLYPGPGHTQPSPDRVSVSVSLGRDTGHTHSTVSGTQSGHGGDTVGCEAECAYSGCPEPARPDRLMCPKHFTHEPRQEAS